MKKIILNTAIIIFLFYIATQIINSVNNITGDINDHIWDGVIGNWQCNEIKYYELEILPSGKYYEYNNSQLTKTGIITINGNTITIPNYFLNCKDEELEKCIANVKYSFHTDTLILDNASNELTFTRKTIRTYK
jgi:hypothetical protein